MNCIKVEKYRELFTDAIKHITQTVVTEKTFCKTKRSKKRIKKRFCFIESVQNSNIATLLQVKTYMEKH